MQLKQFFFLFCSFCSFHLMAQCTDDFNLGNDTSLCGSQFLNLTIPNIYDEYTWQDNSTLNTFQVNGPGTYYCITSLDNNINLVSNGNFELGNTMFTSDYTYYPIADVFGPQASYGIINNANTWFNPFNPCTDHTSGSGLMMVVDGSSFNGGNDAIWCQDIPVQFGSSYRFTYWIQSVTNSSVLANIQIRINGIPVSTELAPLGACNWQEREVLWTSTTSGTASFCLYDLELAGNGNDFAIDDISIVQYCEYTDTIIVTPRPIDTTRVTELICPGDSLFLNGSWQTNSGIYYDFIAGVVCNEIRETTLQFISIDTSFATVEICPNDSIFLGDAWQTTPGIYYDEIPGVNCNEILETSLSWSELDSMPVFAEICRGDSVFLEGAWQTIPGIYFDFLPNTNCGQIIRTELAYILLDTIFVSEEICASDSLFLQGEWQSNPGIYYESIPSSTCDDILATSLIVNPAPIANAGNDITVSFEQVVSLNALSSANSSTFLWSSSDNFISSNQRIDVEVDSVLQTYYLQVESNGCLGFDTISIFGIPLNLAIQVPTAFSPNLDNINDVFRLVNSDEFEEIVLKIYNRWGELIHLDQGVDPIWNGKLSSGKESPLGTYIFYIQAKPYGDVEKLNSSGNFTLIR